MKKIVKNFNNLIKNTIFKVENKTNDKFAISAFSKYLITFITLLFLYLFYLLIPLLYEKSWVQTNIENKLLNEFKVSVSNSADISYRILPAPHFLIKDSTILLDDEKTKKLIAEVKDLKVFLSQSNFFDKNKMSLKKIDISKANFSFLRNDFQLLKDFKNKKLSNKKIKVTNSHIFFKDNLKEIIAIIKIDKSTLFFDDKKLLNLINFKGEIFNIPFNINFQSSNEINGYEEINFNANSLKLDILNKSTTNKDKFSTGENVVSFLNSTINTKYNIEEKFVIFKSANSRLNNLQIDYNGKLSINPFDLNLKIYLDDYNISKLFVVNPVLNEFIKSGLLFNENISINTSAFIDSNSNNEFFQKGNINFNIINGKINLNKTKLVSDSIGSLELVNSNLFVKNNKLLFNADIFIAIKNSQNLFSFLNTNKSSRKEFKNILINLDYDFLTNQIKFNNVKIDNNKVSNNILRIIDNFNNNNLNNFNKSRRLLNEILSIYAG
jgi:hypothetical protein